MITFNILMMVILLVAFLLIVVIMVQQPKGGGLSSTFGGNAQVVGGVQNTTNFLDKSTWTLGALLIFFILAANIVIKKSGADVNDSKLIEGVTPTVPAMNKKTTPAQGTKAPSTPKENKTK